MRMTFALTLLLLLTAGLAFAPPLELNLPPVTEPPPDAPEVMVGSEIQAEPFTIAHLRNSDEFTISSREFDRIRQTLNSDPAIRQALRELNRGPVEIIAADSHRDLLRRMNASEFDMVFCPSLVFVQQEGDYEVLGQVRDPGVVGSGDRGMGLLRTSVIFVNRSSPMFNGPAPGSADWGAQRGPLAAAVESQSMAVVSASSSLGYVVPLLLLRKSCDLASDPHTVFFDSPEETVMAVLNNLLPMGACDRATFDRVVRDWVTGTDPQELIRVVIETPPMPTSPVVVQSSYHPAMAGPMGVAIRESLSRALEQTGDPPLQLVDATPRVFARLNPVVAEFYGEEVTP